MDKILSTRLDESYIQKLNNLVRILNTTKKQIIEKAIELYTIKVEEEMKKDIFDQTFGSWQREESATEIVKKTRKAFHDNMLRHQR